MTSMMAPMPSGLSFVALAQREAAERAAASAWVFLGSCGLMRPGMNRERPAGLLWAEAGLPLDMVAFALEQALDVPEDRCVVVQPEDTLAAAALRWIVAHQDT